MPTRHPLTPKDLVKWNPRDEALIARYVRALMDILTIDSSGRVTTAEAFKLEVYAKILSQKVELRGITALEVRRELIGRTAFVRLKKYKVQNQHTFRQGLAAEVRQYLRRPIVQYWILLPLNIAPSNLVGFRLFSILDTRLIVRTWKHVRKNFALDLFLQDARFIARLSDIDLQTKFTPIMVHAEGRDAAEAFRRAAEAFELFRQLLSLQSQFGRFTMQYGGYPRPLGKILPPPAYAVFGIDGEYKQYWFNTTRDLDYKSNHTPVEYIRSARKLATRLRSPIHKDDTATLLIEALQKYGEALDTSEWRHAFLLLWQILELLALQSAEQLNMKTVVNRMSMLLGQDRVKTDLLLALYETRNALVHRGHFPEQRGLLEVNLLKHIAEQSINAIYNQMRSLPTRQSLARYYDHATAGNSELADRKRIIGHIQRRRAKKSS